MKKGLDMIVFSRWSQGHSFPRMLLCRPLELLRSRVALFETQAALLHHSLSVENKCVTTDLNFWVRLINLPILFTDNYLIETLIWTN